ncbi:uncharacterized protein BYT42DRAFT_479887, partial [Radiomyces spectabilis]|uniref:uncharacterized protein n=1 Tax=Radiomyces spectabilis TaxID=64574 RepID=UPI0022204570
RTFIPPGPTHGFQYVYLPSRGRIPIGQLRKNLHKIGVDNVRVLDLHYPARQVVAALIHNDYATDFTALFTKHGVHPIADFNPADPKHLGDPQFKDLPITERTAKAQEFFSARMIKAVNGIRFPVKYAVARFFASQQWISPETLAQILPSRPS